ncbi:hypothetical protein HaLaN_19083, partial [Haematococcus lacustris]
MGRAYGNAATAEELLPIIVDQVELARREHAQQEFLREAYLLARLAHRCTRCASCPQHF